jgi:hypothetical protein
MKSGKSAKIPPFYCIVILNDAFFASEGPFILPQHQRRMPIAWILCGKGRADQDDKV